MQLTDSAHGTDSNNNPQQHTPVEGNSASPPTDEGVAETPREEHRILVVGSRGWDDAKSIHYHLDAKTRPLLFAGIPVRIVTGGAKGADSIAEEYAKQHNIPLTVMRAEWERYGNRAGWVRNERMHAFVAEVQERSVLVFWDGKSLGTQHSFELAKKYNNPLACLAPKGISI